MQLDAKFIIEKTLQDLPLALAGNESIQRLREFLTHLPKMNCNFYGYECPLDGDEYWVDLSIRMPLFVADLYSLLKSFHKGEVSHEISKSELWSLYFAFLQKAQEHDFFWQENIDFMWTEFDVGSSSQWPPDPNLYFPGPQVKDLVKCCRGFFSLLKIDADLPAALLSKVCDECLSKNLKINFVGFMLPRTRQGVRLCVDSLSTSGKALGDFLDKVGYLHKREELINFIQKIAPFISHVVLHIDLSEQIQSKLGIECSFLSDLTFSERRKRWEAFLQFLVHEGFTTPEKQKGALSWIGGFYESLDQSVFYPNSAVSSKNPTSYLQVIRNIHHIKFIYNPESHQQIKAKIYLDVSYGHLAIEMPAQKPLLTKPINDQSKKTRNDPILQLFPSSYIAERSEKISDFSEYRSCSGSFYEIFPKSCSDVCKIISMAYQHKLSLRIRGNGHSCNGSSLPKKGELLIRSDLLNSYSFEEADTVTVEAGVNVWDLNEHLARYGYRLTVYNGSYSAPSLGGFISAGGIGFGSGDNAFWNIVEEVEFVTAEGQVVLCKKDDQLFPWLFGSMGQLGYFTKAKIKIVPRGQVVYPLGTKGRVKNTHPFRLKMCWFSLISSISKASLAASLLRKYEKEHLDVWIPCEFFRASFKCTDFNPPLLYPSTGDFVLSAVWGLPKKPEGFDRQELLNLEKEFHKIVLIDPNFRRYIQAEITPENFDYRAYFGEKVYGKFQEIKRTLDPLGLINRGIVF